MKVSIMWLMMMAILMLLMVAIKATQKKSNWYKEKWNQFECGFNTMSPNSTPFSFQFFLVAILFLIFDVEIAMILSYPTEPLTSKNMIIMFAFLLTLTIGLLYEWQKSKIEWSK